MEEYMDANKSEKKRKTGFEKLGDKRIVKFAKIVSVDWDKIDIDKLVVVKVTGLNYVDGS